MAIRVNQLWNLFGKEYAWAPRWDLLERCYIHTFGVVDLPSRLRARLVIRAVQKLGGSNLLDFGCGAGTYSFYFSRVPNVLVRGIDVNESRIADCKFIAQKIGRKNLEFYWDDGLRCLKRFGDESFDSVLAIEVLQYLPELKLTMFEIHRVLKSGGNLLGHVPALGYLRETEQNIFDDNSIQNLLIETGFEIVVFTSTFGGPIQKLCKVFDRIVNLRVLTAFLYPLLLILCFPFKVESSEGSYRLFVARKPMVAEKQTQGDRRQKIEDRSLGPNTK